MKLFNNKYVLPTALAIIGITLWFATVSYAASSLGQANIFDTFLKKFFQPVAPNTLPAIDREAVSATYNSKLEYEDAIIKTVEKVSPAVVAITISKNVPILENCSFNPFSNLPDEFQQFLGQDFQFSQLCNNGKTQKQNIGGGSGFIVSADGLIITNKHVVSDADASYTVFTNDGKKYDAKVLARDSVQDLAIIKIEAVGLPVVTLGNSDTLRLGQTVISIGNALGEFRNTVSVGVVSGLSRNVSASGRSIGTEQLEGVIQTDTAINPGNSGGPLLNLRGEVIGINTAIVSGAQNIGFAIPINNAKRDISSVKTTGKISIPFLGVRYMVLTEESAKKEGLSVKYGALIRGNDDGPAVTKGGPADKAGIQAEDVILNVNGTNITTEKSLLAVIQKYSVGDTINVKILREGKELTLQVKLEERK